MIVDDIFSCYFINFITIIINQIPIAIMDNNNGLLNSYNEGDKEKNKETLNQNKTEFYTHLFNIDGESYGLFRIILLTTLMMHWQTRLK